MSRNLSILVLLLGLLGISYGQNVGIGTATPQAKLEVKAGEENQTGPVEAIRIWGPNQPLNANSAQDLKWKFQSAGSAGIRAYRGSSWGTYLQFLTNPTLPGGDNPQVRMTISENGNVGIGTTAPVSRLDIFGNRARFVFSVDHSNTADWGGAIDLYRTGDGHRWHISGPRGGTQNGQLGFYYHDGTAYTHAMTMTRTGNIGIGTSFPGRKLDVVGDVEVNGNIYLVDDAGGSSSNIMFGYPTTTGRFFMAPFDEGAWQWNREFGYAPSLNRWYVENGFYVATGRVSIGTASPTATLDVNGNVRIRGGNPGQGKVLTSDANGTATWEYPNHFDAGIQIYNSPGTYTWICPPGVYQVKVITGGGGGGSSDGMVVGDTWNGGGGGASFGVVPVIPGNSYAVIVGAPGSAGYGNAATAGGSSSFAGQVVSTGGGPGSSISNTHGTPGTGTLPGGPGRTGALLMVSAATNGRTGGTGGAGGVGFGSAPATAGCVVIMW